MLPRSAYEFERALAAVRGGHAHATGDVATAAAQVAALLDAVAASVAPARFGELVATALDGELLADVMGAVREYYLPYVAALCVFGGDALSWNVIVVPAPLEKIP